MSRSRILRYSLAAITAGIVLFSVNYSAAGAPDEARKPLSATAGKATATRTFAWQAKRATPARTLAKTKIYRRLLQSTGWLVIRDGNGRVRGSATAWIIDAEHRLAITCWHCVSHGPFDVYFPVRKNGTLITDPAHYLQRETPAAARVVFTDRINDLALLELDAIPRGMTQLPLAPKSPETGEDMFTVGGKPNGSDGLWQFATGIVRLVAMQQNAQRHRTKMVQGQDGTNRGNSGGALVNQRGEVIAVVEGGPLPQSAENVSWNVDVEVIRAFADAAVKLLRPASADAFVRRGRMHLADGRMIDALRDFDSAIRRDSQSRQAYEYRGTLRYLAGDYRGAVDDFRSAVKNGSRQFSVYSLLGSACAALGRTDEAIATLSKAIKIDSRNWKLYRQRGTLYLKAGNYKSADADLTTALNTMSFATGRGGSFQDLAQIFLDRGMARYQLGQYREALVDLRLAERKLSPNAREARRARVLKGLCTLRLAKSTPAGRKPPAGRKQPRQNVQYVTN